jgi:hypothetical protein
MRLTMMVADGYNSEMVRRWPNFDATSGSEIMNRFAGTMSLGLSMACLVVDQSANKASACPNCKEAVSLDAGEVSNVSSGYNWSVMFMLAVPLSMVGTGAFMVRRAVRQGTLPEM